MFDIHDEPLPGVFVLNLERRSDRRGSFLKLFQASRLANLPEPPELREIYLSSSIKDVVRGMHFQTPPHDYDKAVTCVDGHVLDVILDLRSWLPSYGKAVSVHLDAESPKLVVIPKGLAHGFSVRSHYASMAYLVSEEHVPSHDEGILWSSLDIDWQVGAPILSDRDAGFVRLADFKSPFTQPPAAR